ncbi:hypothetical protein F444_18309 [Phytophthora nicotianae P1976]|uniref:Uncharacterized protein n=1 Tax=Phytophthora nicotianae P1976 TaxID=1317066 RepID=A0A080ZBW9_PHYNI|nr:hypothetical protein F444_18309 [Phytophthora nicotianae P1976]
MSFIASAILEFGAMDRAAAKGQVAIMEWLHSSRNEGFSALAFTRAAANDHLQAFTWLTQHYSQHSSPANCLTAAAENGHFEIVRLLRPQVHRRRVDLAIESAAANGQVGSIKALLPGKTTDAFVISDKWKLKALVERFSFVSIGPALILAVENRQYEVVGFLLHSSDSSILSTIGIALENVALCGDAKTAKLLVKRSSFHDAARALNTAASRNDLAMVEVLAAKSGESYRVDTFKVGAMVRAAKDGRMELMETLINYSNNRTKEEAVLQLSSIANTDVLSSIVELDCREMRTESV